MNAPLSLTEYQNTFAHLLFADEAEPDVASGSTATPTPAAALRALTRQPGFAVYRNTVMKACIDALQANYPTVCRLVGEEWFRAACALYVRAHPPVHPTLLYYGADFADFLAGFLISIEAAADLPYLPGVARLDRCWSEAHAAADAPVVDAAMLAQLAPETLAQGVLALHPAARWRWCEEAPAYSIWHANRVEAELDENLPWQPEGALLTRATSTVTWRAASRADCAFLDACAAGLTVAQAAQAALECASQADMPASDDTPHAHTDAFTSAPRIASSIEEHSAPHARASTQGDTPDSPSAAPVPSAHLDLATLIAGLLKSGAFTAFTSATAVTTAPTASTPETRA